MKARVIIGGIAVALLMAGCSAAPEALPESDYFEMVQDNVSVLDGATDEQLRTVGKQACEAMKSAGNDNEAYAGTLKALLDSGLEAGEAGQFIVYATSTYCPDQVDRIPLAD